jgi:hypothetical protein
MDGVFGPTTTDDPRVAVARCVLESLGQEVLGQCVSGDLITVRGTHHDVVLSPDDSVRLVDRVQWTDDAGPEAQRIHEVLSPALTEWRATRLRGGERSLTFLVGHRQVEILSEGGDLYSVRVRSRGALRKIHACCVGVTAGDLSETVRKNISTL